MKKIYIYILTNKGNKVLYIGVTNDLNRRYFEYISKVTDSFSAKYNLNKLVFFQEYKYVNDALNAQKKLKRVLRAKKLVIISDFNPQWKNLMKIE